MMVRRSPTRHSPVLSEVVREEARDERERRDGRDGLKTEVFGASNPDLQPLALGPRQFHLSRLSQTSAIAAEARINRAG
jgi:hypothetical protein